MEKDFMAKSWGTVLTLEPGAICAFSSGRPGKFFLMNLMSNVVWEAAVSTMRLHGTPLMVHCATRSLLWASLVSRTGFRSVMETTGLAWAGSGCSAAERGSAPNARRAAEARKRLHGKSIPYW